MSEAFAEAESTEVTDELPRYPAGHEYYGPFVAGTLTDGWCYGAITEFLEPDTPEGCASGDGFVVAPDGSYCGLVWWTECPWEFKQIEGPRGERFWGIFEVRFPKPVNSVADLVDNFRAILPALQQSYEHWHTIVEAVSVPAPSGQ